MKIRFLSIYQHTISLGTMQIETETENCNFHRTEFQLYKIYFENDDGRTDFYDLLYNIESISYIHLKYKIIKFSKE